MQEAYITRISKYLPNDPVSNEDMELYIGKINNKPSLSRKIVLHNNRITKRYYAIDKHGKTTHTNAELTAEAIKGLTDKGFSTEDIQMLCCGTTSPDQLLPSHAAMVHGLLKSHNIEISSFAGSCCSGMQAMKFAYLSILSGNTKNAVCTGSERLSRMLSAANFEKESEKLEKMNDDPYIAFDKEFLRWMLSDGAGAALLENKPTNKINLKIEWIENCSYANKMETCMYAGSEKLDDGSISGWWEYPQSDWLDKSLFSFKQDVKLLSANIVKLGNKYLMDVAGKHKLDVKKIDYFLPHLSSEFFREKIMKGLKESDMYIPYEKWFTNLTKVGNVGAASVYLMLEELMNSGNLKKGQKLLLMVPESARFSYSYSLLTAC